LVTSNFASNFREKYIHTSKTSVNTTDILDLNVGVNNFLNTTHVRLKFTQLTLTGTLKQKKKCVRWVSNMCNSVYNQFRFGPHGYQMIFRVQIGLQFMFVAIRPLKVMVLYFRNSTSTHSTQKRMFNIWITSTINNV
jgi:hypothetical protein